MNHFKLSRQIVALVPLVGAALLTWGILALVVNTPSIAQAEPTSGVVGTGTPGSCTATALNTALSGGGNVTFNCGANPVTIVITSQRTIATNTTINGGGKITLSGGGATKIFLVNPGIRLTLTSITISNGRSTFGGCIGVAGGTLNATKTTIQNCAGFGPIVPGSGKGGAIYAINATINLTDTAILTNSTDFNGGGLYLFSGHTNFNNVSLLNNKANSYVNGSGGGLYITATAQVTIINSLISNNHIGYTGQGGGVYAFSSTLKQYNTMVTSNQAANAADGGGLYVEGGSVLLSGGSVSYNKGLYDGGGMSIQKAQADLTGVTLSGNYASSNGGGLFAFQSTLNLTDVVVSRNTVGSDGAGLHCYTCTGKFIRVTVDGNSATSRDGGGMLAYLSTFTIRDSTFRNNTNVYGGGIYNSDSTLTIDNVTINNNTATSQGGGIYNEGIANLTNSTLSGNMATTGGAFYNKDYVGLATLTLTNVTIHKNGATDGGSIYNYNDANTSVNIKNTIIADSISGGNCKGKDISSAKNSISSDNTCILIGTDNHTNTDPLLTFLADNGGWTMTILPLTGSPAVNGVIGSDSPLVDQRGVARPQNGSYDIGSVERAPSDPLYPVAADLPIVFR